MTTHFEHLLHNLLRHTNVERPQHLQHLLQVEGTITILVGITKHVLQPAVTNLRTELVLWGIKKK